MIDLVIYVEEGLSGAEIATKINSNVTTIYQWARKQKIVDKLLLNGRIKQGGLSDKNKVYLAIQRVEEGNTLISISKELGISTTTVKNYIVGNRPELVTKIKETGNKNKVVIKVTTKMINKMVELSRLGQGLDMIGDKLGLDGGTIRRYLKKVYTPEEYEERHSKKKYTDYWSGKTYKNERGDTLQSSLEEKVVDYLYNKGVAYQTHSKGIKIGNKQFYPDIYLPKQDTHIEVLGMMDMKFYKEKAENKIKIYKENNIRCIFITKKEINILGSILGGLGC